MRLMQKLGKPKQPIIQIQVEKKLVDLSHMEATQLIFNEPKFAKMIDRNKWTQE